MWHGIDIHNTSSTIARICNLITAVQPVSELGVLGFKPSTKPQVSHLEAGSNNINFTRWLWGKKSKATGTENGYNSGNIKE